MSAKNYYYCNLVILELLEIKQIFHFHILLAGQDGSLFLLPTQVSSSAEVEQDWPLDDVTALPSLCGLKGLDFSPSAVTWWDRTVSEGRCQ